jgi:opacity protein-like surface antigen
MSPIPVATFALLLLPVAALAQESTTRGLNIGIHLSAASLTVEGEERNDAGGAGISVGYGLNRNFSLFLQVDGARFDDQATANLEGDWTLGHIDLGLRYSFANSLRKWVPYVQGALDFRAVKVSDPVVDGSDREEAELSGTGITLGGGLTYYFTEAFALDAQLLWTAGEFNTLRVENVSVTGFDVDADSGRFNLGISWWP